MLLLALESAFPPLRLAQDDLWRDTFAALYADVPGAEKIFRRSGVVHRHLSADLRPELSAAPVPTSRRIALWLDSVLQMGRQSIPAALARLPARLGPAQIGSFIFVSCTGYHTPGPDILLAQEFELPPTLRRTVVGHTGCHAAFPGLKLAADALAARPGELVLLHCAETCTLHIRQEPTPEQAVCHALFGDATATAILASPELLAAHPPAAAEKFPAPTRLLATATLTLPGTTPHMSWAILDDGFRMTLSPEIPRQLAHALPPFIESLLAPFHLQPADIPHWAIHPGGPKILDLAARALHLPPAALDPSRRVLAQHGNCSSPTVLLVLREILRADPPPSPGQHAVLLAFGPGLTLEAALMKF